MVQEKVSLVARPLAFQGFPNPIVRISFATPALLLGWTACHVLVAQLATQLVLQAAFAALAGAEPVAAFAELGAEPVAAFAELGSEPVAAFAAHRFEAVAAFAAQLLELVQAAFAALGAQAVAAFAAEPGAAFAAQLLELAQAAFAALVGAFGLEDAAGVCAKLSWLLFP